MDADPGANSETTQLLTRPNVGEPGIQTSSCNGRSMWVGKNAREVVEARRGVSKIKCRLHANWTSKITSTAQRSSTKSACPPKMSQAQNGLFTTYAPGLSKNGCLCSILHGLLQLQIWTAFLLPARLFPTVARQSATQLSHTTFSQVSRPTQGSSFTCTLLFPFPARFSALHYRSPSLTFRPHLHKRAVIAITPQTPPSRLLVRLLPRLGRRYACPGRQVCHRPAGWAFLPVPSAIGEERCHKETPCHFY
jgi:hypothetical protein